MSWVLIALITIIVLLGVGLASAVLGAAAAKRYWKKVINIQDVQIETLLKYDPDNQQGSNLYPGWNEPYKDRRGEVATCICGEKVTGPYFQCPRCIKATEEMDVRSFTQEDLDTMY